MEDRPPWSPRRRRLLLGLAGATGATFVAGMLLPDQYGVTALFLAALCGFLLVAATVVFLVVPGPGTLGTLLRSLPLAGAVLVVAVLLVLSTAEALRLLWAGIATAAAAWTGFAAWAARSEA